MFKSHDHIKLWPIRRSKSGDEEISGEIHKLLEQGLLKYSTSPWASHMLLIKKKDGFNFVVIDYRKLNAISKKNLYPLPRIDNTLDRLHSAKYFSAMNLLSGYW